LRPRWNANTVNSHYSRCGAGARFAGCRSSLMLTTRRLPIVARIKNEARWTRDRPSWHDVASVDEGQFLPCTSKRMVRRTKLHHPKKLISTSSVTTCAAPLSLVSAVRFIPLRFPVHASVGTFWGSKSAPLSRTSSTGPTSTVVLVLITGVAVRSSIVRLAWCAAKVQPCSSS